MNATVLLFIVIGIVIGFVIGWLLGSREVAGAKHGLDHLRLQLDDVLKERDLNRSAAHDLAALKAAGEEREKAFRQQIEALKDAKESLSGQFHEIASKLLGD
ncbi:MAG TPA: hypothetical protein VJ846_08390, partial [Sphingomicrobium sp.]|nr:hypothetical protein [Sphingomicrobium sp.]